MIAARRVMLAGSFLFLAAAAPAPETRSLFAVKEFPAFQVIVPAEAADWCSDTARVTITGQSPEQFIQNQPVIERIVGGVRAILSFECPQAASIAISGKVQGQAVYQASASATDSWRLGNVQLRSPEQLKMLADLETISRCDELASDLSDPEAVEQGVSDDDLDGAATVVACRSAIALDAETPRFRYQLARGFLAQGNSESAVEELIVAGEAGHAGALALLGDIYLSGAAGIEADPATARGLYERSAEAGYGPAKTVLSQFEDQTTVLAEAEKEERVQTQAETVARSVPRTVGRQVNAASIRGLRQKVLVVKIQQGRFDNFSGSKLLSLHYINSFVNGYRAVCPDAPPIATADEARMYEDWYKRYASNLLNILAAGSVEQLMPRMQSDGESDGGEVALAENCSASSYRAAGRNIIDLVQGWTDRGEY